MFNKPSIQKQIIFLIYNFNSFYKICLVIIENIFKKLEFLYKMCHIFIKISLKYFFSCLNFKIKC